MIAEQVQAPDLEPSAKNQETEAEDSPKGDPDRIRGEVFKRMFPDVPRRASE
jgi:hypothetical protein